MTLRQFTQAIAGVLCTAGFLAGAEPPGTESLELPLISRDWYEYTDPERTAKYVIGTCLGLPKLGQLWLEHPATEPEARTYRVWFFESCQLRTAWTSYSTAIQSKDRIFEFWIHRFDN